METSDNRDLLSVTAFFSALIHATIILGISFKLPDIASLNNTDNSLDVILLNTANNEAPVEAETVSTSNNEGGGEDDQEATSPIPYEPVRPSPVKSVVKVAEQEAEKKISPDQLITAQQGDVSVQRMAPDETRLESKSEQKGSDVFTTKSQRQLERERLIAKIRQTEEDYNKRPKKVFLSPTTKEHGAAKYLDEWRKRVVTTGNADYPLQIKARELTGTLILSVSINPNGTVNDIDILTPSPHRLLNEAAVRFVRDASPFQSFPEDEYFKDIDILVVTRSFHFLPGNRVTSSAAPRQ